MKYQVPKELSVIKTVLRASSGPKSPETLLNHTVDVTFNDELQQLIHQLVNRSAQRLSALMKDSSKSSLPSSQIRLQAELSQMQVMSSLICLRGFDGDIAIYQSEIFPTLATLLQIVASRKYILIRDFKPIVGAFDHYSRLMVTPILSDTNM